MRMITDDLDCRHMSSKVEYHIFKAVPRGTADPDSIKNNPAGLTDQGHLRPFPKSSATIFLLPKKTKKRKRCHSLSSILEFS